MITLKNWSDVVGKRQLSDGRMVDARVMEIEIDARGLSNEERQKEMDAVLKNPDFVVTPSTMAVSTDYGAPTYPSTCTVLTTAYDINVGEFTEIFTYIMGGDKFYASYDLVPADVIDGELDVTANGIYTPETVPDNTKFAWQKVNVNVDIDPSRLQELTLNITENGASTLEPEEGFLGFSKFNLTVNVPTPTGSTTITTNGTHDVTNYAEAVVNVPTKVGTVIGTATTVQDVTRYQVEYATLKGIMDTSDELVFKLSDSEYTRPLMTFYNSGNSTGFEIVDYLDSQSDIERTVSTKIIHIVDSNGENPDALTDEQRTFLHDNIVSKVPYNIFNYYT